MSPLARSITAFSLALSLYARAADGDTTILKWKDGKKAAFALGFDDNAPSQLKNAVPELDRRKIPGTFYLVTGNGVWAATKAKWQEAAKSPYIVVANHTFTHKGANSVEELGPEIEKCNAVLQTLQSDRKAPYLMSFGKPGGVPWKVTDAEVAAAMDANHLINRPPFAGPPINYKSAEETLAVVDKALTRGDLGYLVFHGVGGDWLVTPVEWFTALLDKLEAHRSELWLTDFASAMKYRTEREGAETKVVETTPQKIRIAFTGKTDPSLYDEPLSLTTAVPAAWKNCTVSQAAAKSSATAEGGIVRYAAVPGKGEIVLSPAP